MSAYSSPVFSIAGAMPGDSEMSHWKTAYLNPDMATAAKVGRTRSHRGPSFSMAGAMPGGSTMAHWSTAYPNGESIYVAALRDTEQRALAQRTDAKVIPFAKPARKRGTPAARAA